jgi:hypothetical protein
MQTVPAVHMLDGQHIWPRMPQASHIIVMLLQTPPIAQGLPPLVQQGLPTAPQLPQVRFGPMPVHCRPPVQGGPPLPQQG